MGICHLLAQDKLNEIVELHLLVCLGTRIGKGLTIGFVPLLMSFPLAEVGSTVLISEE